MPLFSDYKAEPYGHKRVSMSRGAYKSAKEGGGRSFSVTIKELSCHVYSDLMPSKQIIGQIIAYNETTSSVEVESRWQITL